MTTGEALASCDGLLDAIALEVDRRLLDSLLSKVLNDDPLDVKVGVGGFSYFTQFTLPSVVNNCLDV